LNFKIISSIIATVIAINFIINLKLHAPEDVKEEDSTESVADQNTSKKFQPLKVQRVPASVQTSAKPNVPVYKPEVKRAEVEKNNFSSVPVVEKSPAPAFGGRGQPSNRSPATQDEPPFARTPAPALSFDLPTGKVEEKAKTNFKEEEKKYLTSTTNNQIPTNETTSKNSASGMASSTTKNTSSNAAPQVNTCSASISGGSFNNPIGVTLNCSTISTIHYCVGIDSGSGCCDPHSASSVYSSRIVVGPDNGNYCLSYYGESASAGLSVDYSHSYTINSTLPNLQVAHPQINYQTTQLTGKTLVTSTDFGKSGYSIGQVNMMTHDPGPSALNLKCEEIVSNYTNYTAPNALEILTALDVSGDNPGLQIEIPFRLDQVDYGDNYVTSYIVNSNYVVPLYSCSTTKITLNDFEYFQENIAFGDTGTNAVREFSGGLTPFGFFEEETVVYRGPAGASAEDNAGQKLEYGMFGIFF